MVICSMATPLSELVHFIGEETAFLAHAKKAVEWIFSKPEGLKILEDAKALHGKPLAIIVDTRLPVSGYGKFWLQDKAGIQQTYEHAVGFSPKIIEDAVLLGTDGQKIALTEEQFFVHEFAHAAQPQALEQMEQYLTRQNQIIQEAHREFNIPTGFPMEKYVHRIKADKSEAGLRQTLSDIYDECIAPHRDGLQDAQRAIKGRIDADPAIIEFRKRFETPALEFENGFMGKYKNTPARNTDYALSSSVDEVIELTLNKDKWLDTNMKAIAKVRDARAHPRIGGKDPSLIRPDAPPQPKSLSQFK